MKCECVRHAEDGKRSAPAISAKMATARVAAASFALRESRPSVDSEVPIIAQENAMAGSRTVSDAVISADGKYRYKLSRYWIASRNGASFAVALNCGIGSSSLKAGRESVC